MDELDIKIKQRLIDDIIIPDKYYIMLDSVFESLPEKSINYTKNKMANNYVQNSVFKKVFAVLSIVITLSGFGVYAGNKIYQEYKQENISIKSEEQKKYFSLNACNITEYYQEMGMKEANSSIVDNDARFYYEKVYYKKIYNFEEFQKIKETWNNLIDISKEDFENNFIMIIGYNAERFDGLKVIDTYVENNRLIIEIADDDGNGERFSNTIVTLIDKKIDAEEVFIKTIPGTKLSEKYGYTPLSKITKDNFNELKEKENWIIVEPWYQEQNLIDKNIEMMDAFSEEKGNRMIRILYIYDTNSIYGNFTIYNGITIIKDLIYENGKCLYYDISIDNDTWQPYEMSFIKENEYNIEKVEKVDEDDVNQKEIRYYIKIESNYYDYQKEGLAWYYYWDSNKKNKIIKEMNQNV